MELAEDKFGKGNGELKHEFVVEWIYPLIPKILLKINILILENN